LAGARKKSNGKPDRGAIDDEIAPADETPMAGQAHQHDKQALEGWGSSLYLTPALLQCAGNQDTPADLSW
jgi:hypothetical protein